MPAGRHPGWRRLRVFRHRAAQHALALGQQFRAGRPAGSLPDLPGERAPQLPDPQHHPLRRRPPRDARGASGGPRSGRKRRHRLGYRRNHGSPAAGPGGTHLHAAEHFQQRGPALLQPVRRRGRTGPGAPAGAGPHDPRYHRPRRNLRPFGTAGADRDVLPRRTLHGHLRQMLSVAPRIWRFGQPRQLLPGLPPSL